MESNRSWNKVQETFKRALKTSAMKPCEAIGFAMLKGIIHSKWRFQSFSSYHIVQRASVDVLFFRNGKNSNPIETLEACDIKGFFTFF